MVYEFTEEERKALLEDGLTEEQIERLSQRLHARPPRVEPGAKDELDQMIGEMAKSGIGRAGSPSELMSWLIVLRTLDTLSGRQGSPEIEGIKSEIRSLRQEISSMAEESKTKKLLEPLYKEIESIKAQLQSPQGGEETQLTKLLRERLDETLKKVERLDSAIKERELEGMKKDIVDGYKSEVNDVRRTLSEVKGRLEEATTTKGSIDRQLARELKILTGIDTKLDILTAKLPSATEALELTRQLREVQPRTSPPRTEEQKKRAYEETIKKLEGEAKINKTKQGKKVK